VSTDATAAKGTSAVIDALVADRQLRNVAGHSMRVFISVMVMDVLLTALFVGMGIGASAAAWFASGVAIQAARWHAPHHYLRTGERPLHALRRFEWLSAAAGLHRVIIIPVLFSQPVGEVHYIFTMVLVGQMAGAVGSMDGVLKGYLLWGLPVAVAAALAWTLQGLHGAGIGLLLALMFTTLAAYVRSSRETLRQLVSLAHERTALVESLQVERDRAEAASQSKTRFFAAASHDLRQPLHALSINATALELLSRRQGDPTIRELSRSIHRALQQSNDLLQGLLDISRLDAGAIVPQWQVLDATRVVQSTVEDFLPAAAQRGIALRAVFPPGPLWLRADREMLARVLNNLVSNAIKFTARGGVEVVVERTIHPGAEAQVVLSVVDTGCGIDAEHHGKVFEEFYQVGNASRDRSAGLGLGLSIVQRSVALLCGELALQSEGGRGTRVDVRFREAAAPAQPVAEHAPDSARESSTDGVDARVLVVDDEPEILMSLEVLLGQFGVELRCVPDRAAAFDQLAAGYVPNVLIVDYRLREDNGVALIGALRERLGPVPALVITGDTEPGRLLGEGRGTTTVLYKPIEGFRLIEAIRQARAESADAV
jgi:signal transduction histidine kinase/ActR/RegA family two-component response regulator